MNELQTAAEQARELLRWSESFIPLTVPGLDPTQQYIQNLILKSQQAFLLLDKALNASK